MLWDLHLGVVIIGNSRIRIMLDVRKPLRRGIFVFTSDSGKMWLAFNYENLLLFCLGCGKMGHEVVDFDVISQEDKTKGEDSFPYSNTLRVESKLSGKEIIQFGIASKLSKVQRNYTGPVGQTKGKQDGGKSR